MSEPTTEAATSEATSEVPSPSKIDPTKTHTVREFDYTSPFIACRFDPTGTFVFAAAQDNTIERFAVESGERVPYVGHESWARGLAFSPQGNTFYSGGNEGRLIAWPAAEASPAPARTVEAHQGWVRAVAVSPDGTLVATAGNDRLVRLWSAQEGTLVRELAGHESHVYNLAFHPSGTHLVSGDLKGVIRQWEVASGSEVRQLDASRLWKYDPGFAADIGGVRAIAFSPDGTLLACGGITDVSNAFAGVGNPAVVLFDWESGSPKLVHLSKEGLQGVVWGLAFHPDGFLIGATGGGGGGSLLFWRPDAEHEFFRLALPATTRDMALHPDGLHLAVAHFDNKVRLYQMTEKPAEVAG